MTRKNRPALTLLAALTSSLGPFVLATAGGAATGCLFSSGPSNVAQGQQYVSGDPRYDRFFNELFTVQYAMGQGPTRLQTIQANLASVSGVASNTPTEDLIDAVGKRAEQLAKKGTTLKLNVAGLEENATPSSVLSSSGTPDDTKDKAFVTTLGQSARDAAALIGDMRRSKPVVERLRTEEPTLEPDVEVTFRKGGKLKKDEVLKNLDDAKKLIPLMSARGDEVAAAAVNLLRKLEKETSTALGSPSPAPPAPAPAADSEAPKKPKKGGGSKAGGETKAAEPGAAKPAEPKPAETKPEKKPPPPPADDFEP